MNFEQRANVKFCFKLGKTFTETFELMRKDYENDWLFCTRVYKWFKKFKAGRKDIKDDEYTGRLKIVVIEKNIQKMRDFIKNEPKTTFCYMESELNIFKIAIYTILIKKLGL